MNAAAGPTKHGPELWVTIRRRLPSTASIRGALAMPQANRFRHQAYTTSRPTSPHYLLNPAPGPAVGSERFLQRMGRIGDTLRVSLTADPVEEVVVGWELLAALDIRRHSPELVSCPTCGRCQVDLIPIANEVAARLRQRRIPIKVAVMGCEVNGPGEARDADIGVASGNGVGLIFAHGQTVRKVPEAEIVDALFAEIDRLEREAE